MSHPYPDMPSLRQFVDNATSQGCSEGEAIQLHGPRGHVTSRYLIGFGPDAPFVVLPDIEDDELIRPGKLAEMVRVLGTVGYEECLANHGFTEVGEKKNSN